MNKNQCWGNFFAYFLTLSHCSNRIGGPVHSRRTLQLCKLLHIKMKLHGNDKLNNSLNLRIMLNLTSFTEKGNEKGAQVQISAVSTKIIFSYSSQTRIL